MREDLRVRLTTALVLVLVFGTGLIMGLAMDRPGSAEAVGPADSPAPSRDAETAARSDHDRVMKHIGLTKDQRATIDSLLGFYQVQMSEFQQEYGPRYWAIVDSSRKVIKDVLNEEQAALYDSLLVENDKRRGRPGASDGSR